MFIDQSVCTYSLFEDPRFVSFSNGWKVGNGKNRQVNGIGKDRQAYWQGLAKYW